MHIILVAWNKLLCIVHSQFVNGSLSGFSWFDKIYLMSCLYFKWSLETIDKNQQNWKEITNTMMKINKKNKGNVQH